MKRYNMDFSCECGRYGEDNSYEDKEGFYISYKDYKAEIKKFRQALEKIAGMNHMRALTAVTFAMDTAREVLKIYE